MLPELSFENIMWALWIISTLALMAAACVTSFPRKTDYVHITHLRYSRHAHPEDGQ